MFLKRSSMREVIFDKFCNTWEKYRYGTLFGHQIFNTGQVISGGLLGFEDVGNDLPSVTASHTRRLESVGELL
jgi:hypothetical protein